MIAKLIFLYFLFYLPIDSKLFEILSQNFNPFKCYSRIMFVNRYSLHYFPTNAMHGVISSYRPINRFPIRITYKSIQAAIYNHLLSLLLLLDYKMLFYHHILTDILWLHRWASVSPCRFLWVSTWWFMNPIVKVFLNSN